MVRRSDLFANGRGLDRCGKGRSLSPIARRRVLSIHDRRPVDGTTEVCEAVHAVRAPAIRPTAWRLES